MRIISNTPHTPLAVLSNMFRVRACLAAGREPVDQHGKPIRIGKVYTGGAMSGANGAAISEVFERAALSDVTQVKVGISAGATTVGASAIHRAHLQIPEYERMADEGLFSIWCPWAPIDYTILTRMLGRVFGTETFDAAHGDVCAVATHAQTGEGRLLDIKREKLPAIHASMAIPKYHQPVRVGNELFVDGGWCPLPLKKVILKYRLTDVLIVSNRPVSSEEYWFELMLDRYTGADTSIDVVRERMMSLKRTRVLVLAPKLTSAIPRLYANSFIIRMQTDHIKRQMEGLLNDAYVS